MYDFTPAVWGSGFVSILKDRCMFLLTYNKNQTQPPLSSTQTSYHRFFISGAKKTRFFEPEAYFI